MSLLSLTILKQIKQNRSSLYSLVHSHLQERRTASAYRGMFERSRVGWSYHFSYILVLIQDWITTPQSVFMELKKSPRLRARKFYGIGTKDEKINGK